VLNDCSKALILNPHSSKAFYRSALALMALERYEECLDCCDKCLAYDPENIIVSSLRKKANGLKEIRDKRAKELEQRGKKEQEERSQLDAAFKVCRFSVYE
jgi:tetratricopeptide (TPR) repeat protein